MPTITVPQAVWDLAKQISGLKNPATFLRNDVLIHWAVTHATDVQIDPYQEFESPKELPPASETAEWKTPAERFDNGDDLLRRKARLNCVDNSFDPHFTNAWAWACNEFGGERPLVEFLEDQTTLAQGRMTNPRGVIIARWRRATTPSA